MMIVPKNPDYPARIAKAYKKQLASQGYEFKFCFLREGVAKMLGHRNHNELLDAAYALAPTPRNSEVPAEEVEERLRTMTERLSEYLGLPDDVTRSLVERYDRVSAPAAAGGVATTIPAVGETRR